MHPWRRWPFVFLPNHGGSICAKSGSIVVCIIKIHFNSKKGPKANGSLPQLSNEITNAIECIYIVLFF